MLEYITSVLRKFRTGDFPSESIKLKIKLMLILKYAQPLWNNRLLSDICFISRKNE
jgi:hypothetical protein